MGKKFACSAPQERVGTILVLWSSLSLNWGVYFAAVNSMLERRHGFLPDGHVLCAQLAGPKLLLYVFHVCWSVHPQIRIMHTIITSCILLPCSLL